MIKAGVEWQVALIKFFTAQFFTTLPPNGVTNGVTKELV